MSRSRKKDFRKKDKKINNFIKNTNKRFESEVFNIKHICKERINNGKDRVYYYEVTHNLESPVIKTFSLKVNKNDNDYDLIYANINNFLKTFINENYFNTYQRIVFKENDK